MYMQSFTPSPLGAQYQSPMALYAQGGHTNQHQMHQDAQELRHYGMGRDKVLAHINPAEASYLQHHHGMSINPHTGLPQFGLWDMMKSGAGALGSAAMSAAPGLWAEYGQPMAQRGLEAIDRRVQGALPGLAQSAGQKLGGQRFGQQLGQLGQSLGQNISNQYGQYGGLAGQVMPRVNQAMGVQGPAQFPQVGRNSPMNAARNIGSNMWNDTGKNMVRQGLQGMDENIMGRLQNVPGVGGDLSEAYGNTRGISGAAMPRINQFMGRMQPQQQYAQGGYVDNHSMNGYGGHEMYPGGMQNLYPFA